MGGSVRLQPCVLTRADSNRLLDHPKLLPDGGEAKRNGSHEVFLTEPGHAQVLRACSVGADLVARGVPLDNMLCVLHEASRGFRLARARR